MITVNLILLVLIYNTIFYRRSNNMYCGLTAFSGSSENKMSVDKMTLLLFYNQDRGKDSLGYYTPETGVLKELGKPEDLMGKPSFKLPITSTFIGHVRHATVGDVNKDNAHPFEYGNIVLAMNGTLSNHWQLATEYGWKISDFNVDSQVLAAIINKTQSKEVLSKIYGGCAIVYCDTSNNKMYAYRNNQRPLFRGSIDGSMYISSIESSLKLIGCNSIKEFKENYLYEIVDGKITSQYNIPVPKTKAIDFSKIMTDSLGYDYHPMSIYELTIQELFGMWLTPDNDHSKEGLYRGFSYRCIGQGKGCSTYDITVINDNGDQINIYKSTFAYKYPIIKVDSYVFSTCKLTYNGGNNDGKVFCNNGDIFKVTNILSKGKYEVKNLVNDLEGTVEDKVVRFGYKNEIQEYLRVNWINNEESEEPFETVIVNQLQLPLNNINISNNKTETEKYSDSLYESEMSETYEEHVDFCMDNIETELADLDEMTYLAPRAKQKIQNIKSVISYYIEGSKEFFFDKEEEQVEQLNHD